ncbi:unnamed protein product, partial [marine sediment metagenome]
AVGLGIGGGSAISRRIGAKDKKGADNVAIHTIIISIIIAVIITNVAPNFAKPLAVSLPIPDVAPVIITIFDFRRNHLPIIFNIG